MEAWREELYHYAKGSTAKDHKYIRKEGNRYIYKEDDKKVSGNAVQNGVQNAISGSSVRPSSPNSQKVERIGNNATIINGHGPGGSGLGNTEAVLGVNANAKNGYKLPTDLQSQMNKAIFALAKSQGVSPENLKGAFIEKWRRSDAVIDRPGFKTTMEGLGIKGIDYDNISNTQISAIIDAMLKAIDLYASGNLPTKHSDTYTKELYHTAIGGTLIITRR